MPNLTDKRFNLIQSLKKLIQDYPKIIYFYTKPKWPRGLRKSTERWLGEHLNP